MARQINRLTELKMQRVKPGWHHDGLGLYLRVEGKDRRWWVFRYGAGGKHYRGLGPVHTIGLTEAREKARECRKQLLDGADPIAAGKAQRAAAGNTFGECARAYHEAHRAGWRSAKHAHQWLASLTAHAGALSDMPVAMIDTAAILKALESTWAKRPETTSRVRGRIEAVLDWAKTRGYREGENPARWRGHLENLLPRLSKRTRVKHHAALPYRDVPKFMAALRQREGDDARALEFLILTAARADEACGASWDEIDLAERLWTIPAARMKAERLHRVPLSGAACAILEQTLADRRHGLLFPGLLRGSRALWDLTKELAGRAPTTQGFRSSFRDWTSEETDFAREVAEMALAHGVEEVEGAYRRGDLRNKRRLLMEAWASYCAGASDNQHGNVTPIRGGGHG
jgi:integrase